MRNHSVGSAYEFETCFMLCERAWLKILNCNVPECTRMKLLTQPATLETTKHKFSLIKGLSIYEKNNDFSSKSQFSVKLSGTCVQFHANLSTNCFVFRKWIDLYSDRINPISTGGGGGGGAVFLALLRNEQAFLFKLGNIFH